MDNNNNNRPSLGVDTIIKLVAGVMLLVVGGVILSTLTPVIFPPQASAEARNVDELFRVLLFIGGIVFFLIQGLLVISVIAFRARPDDDSDGPSHHGNMTLEIVWTIIPSLVVVFLAILSFNVWNQNTAPKEDENMVNGDSLTINVTGARYAWSHEYETPEVNIDGEPIVINTGAILHVYVGQNVNLIMRTQDVIHSYWVPAMRVKQDLLPGDPADGGRPTNLRFTPILVEDTQYPVEYPIVCAELCGDGHGRMRGTVVVYENETQFLEMFYEPKIEELSVPPSDPIILGEQVIQGYACSGCHVLDDLGWAGLTGPTLNGIADRAGERVAGQSAEEYLVTSIWNSGAYLAPGYQNLMPVFGPDQPGANEMTGEELYAIVAYLCTQGEDSDCDMDNTSTAIPEAIDSIFGVSVDVTFGRSEDTGDAGAEATAEVTAEPEVDNAEATAEPESDSADAEATAEAEATEESSD